MTFLLAQVVEAAQFAVDCTACQAGSDRGLLNGKLFLDTYRSAVAFLYRGLRAIGAGLLKAGSRVHITSAKHSSVERWAQPLQLVIPEGRPAHGDAFT